MHEPHISNVVLATNRTNHKLGLPQLLIVGNMVVACLTVSNLEDSVLTLKRNLDSLQLFSVNLLELQNEFLLGNVSRLHLVEVSGEVARVTLGNFDNLELTEGRIVSVELSYLWLTFNCKFSLLVIKEGGSGE